MRVGISPTLTLTLRVPSGQRVAPEPQTFLLQKVKIVIELLFLLYNSASNLLLNENSSDNRYSDKKYSNYYKYFNKFNNFNN